MSSGGTPGRAGIGQAPAQSLLEAHQHERLQRGDEEQRIGDERDGDVQRGRRVRRRREPVRIDDERRAGARRPPRPGSTTVPIAGSVAGGPRPTRRARPARRRPTPRWAGSGRGLRASRSRGPTSHAWRSERRRERANAASESAQRRQAFRRRRAPAGTGCGHSAHAASAYRATTATWSKIIGFRLRLAARCRRRAVYLSARVGPADAQVSPGNPDVRQPHPTALARRQDAARRGAPHRRQHPGRAARSAPRAARGRRRAAGRQGLRRRASRTRRSARRSSAR